jgi:hypothetical protein
MTPAMNGFFPKRPQQVKRAYDELIFRSDVPVEPGNGLQRRNCAVMKNGSFV